MIPPRLRRGGSSPARIGAALKQLQKIGALELDGESVKAQNVVIKHGFNLAKAYRVALERAIDQLKTFPGDPSAQFDSFCLIMSEAEFEQIRAVLEEAKARAGKIAAKRDEPKSRVAYLNTNLFWASARI